MKSFTLVADLWVDWAVFGTTVLLLIVATIATRKGLLPSKKLGFLVAGLLLIQVGQHLTIYLQTYTAYLNDSVSKYLLPPYNQFLISRAVLSLNTIIVNWAMGAALFGVWWWLAIKKTGGAYLDSRDVILLTFVALAVGWPGWLVAYAGTFALAVLGMIVLVILRKKKVTDRLIVTPYIIPAAILTLIFKAWLLDWTGLIKIRF